MSRKEDFKFQQPKTSFFILNNLEKFIFSLIALIILVYFFSEKELNLIGIVIGVFLLLFVAIVYIKMQSKFAHKLKINFESKIVIFELYRKSGNIVINFGDIKKIKVNGYVIVEYDHDKLFVSHSNNIMLLKSLGEIKDIEWGWLCIIWGPPLRIRKEVSQYRTSEQ